MSGTPTPTPAPLAANPGQAPTLLDKAVAVSRNLPQLEANVKMVAPDLVATVEQPALTAAHGAWGTLLVPAVAYLVARFGLGWDSNMVDLVAGGFALAGAAAIHYLSVALPTLKQKVLKL